MKRLSLVIAAALAVGLLMSGKSVAQQPNEMTREERAAAVVEAVKKLDWKYGPQTVAVEPLNGAIEVAEGEILTEGRDAEEYVRLTHGAGEFKPDAVVLRLTGPNMRSLVIYQYVETGHVKLDDWEKKLQPGVMLANIKKSVEEDNRNLLPGYSKSYVDGWVEEPYIDRETGVVYWAIKSLNDRGGQTINARAIKLERTGVTSIFWVGETDRFTGTQQDLAPAVEAYRTDEGHRYADFQPGVDKTAESDASAKMLEVLTATSPSN